MGREISSLFEDMHGTCGLVIVMDSSHLIHGNIFLSRLPFPHRGGGILM